MIDLVDKEEKDNILDNNSSDLELDCIVVSLGK